MGPFHPGGMYMEIVRETDFARCSGSTQDVSKGSSVQKRDDQMPTSLVTVQLEARFSAQVCIPVCGIPRAIREHHLYFHRQRGNDAPEA